MVDGGDPFYLKFWVIWPPLERNCQFHLTFTHSDFSFDFSTLSIRYWQIIVILISIPISVLQYVLTIQHNASVKLKKCFVLFWSMLSYLTIYNSMALALIWSFCSKHYIKQIPKKRTHHIKSITAYYLLSIRHVKSIAVGTEPLLSVHTVIVTKVAPKTFCDIFILAKYIFVKFR